MDKQRIIGYRGEGHRYEVAINWDTTSSPPSTIALSEGSGHGEMGGCFALSEMLKERWTINLKACDCLWLRELAVEEQTRGQFFSADEIYAIWQARSKKNK